ncbi:MAG: DinB family protein [Ilumatobacteraceae bacterium]
METTPRIDIDWTTELNDQLDWHWKNQLRPRLANLTDDEYLWEPVPGCWSLRRRDEATTAMAAGAGETVADFDFPEPDPAPLTTIAWRMGHISIGVLGARAADHFGTPGTVDYPSTDWPLTAAGGLRLLDHHYDGWTTGVRSLDDADLRRPCGPSEGPFAEHPMAALILHITREVIHHGAELCLLRDLYRTSNAGTEWSTS